MSNAIPLSPVVYAAQLNQIKGFLLRDRAGVDAAQEEVEQALAGGGVVEDVADQRRLRRLVDEVLEPRPGGVDALEEEAVQRAVARHELRRMQIPALIEAAGK